MKLPQGLGWLSMIETAADTARLMLLHCSITTIERPNDWRWQHFLAGQLIAPSQMNLANLSCTGHSTSNNAAQR